MSALRSRSAGSVSGPLRDGDADRGADEDLVAEQVEGLADLAQQALAEFLGGAEILDVEDDDGELVAAQPGDGVDLPHRVLQARGGLPDQLVAARVAERVVDGLEAIEVDIEQADLALVARHGKQSAFQPVLEQRAVRQAGQRVVEGEILRLALAALQLAGGAAQAPQQEKEDAGGEQQACNQRRARLSDQRQARPVLVPGDVAEDDAVRADQRDAGVGQGRGQLRQQMHVAELVLPGDMVDDLAVDELDGGVDIFRAGLLRDAIGIRHDRLDGEESGHAADGDEVADHQRRRVVRIGGLQR